MVTTSPHGWPGYVTTPTCIGGQDNGTPNSGYSPALGTMRAALDRLDGEQRDQVEQASAVLRKVRAGARLPLEDITRREETL